MLCYSEGHWDFFRLGSAHFIRPALAQACMPILEAFMVLFIRDMHNLRYPTEVERMRRIKEAGSNI